MYQDKPLAEKMRPKNIENYVGQKHILSPGRPLYQAIEKKRLHSMILWGPPGTGKTTLGQIIAHHSDAFFTPLSAVLSGVKDIRIAIEEAKKRQDLLKKNTILFIDEIHRFNKSQQDAFLPHVENGTVFLIGATTENPSFELNKALLSRARIYVLTPLDQEDLEQVLNQALEDKACGYGEYEFNFSSKHKEKLISAADQDARKLLNLLEILISLAPNENGLITITDELIMNTLVGTGHRRFDKGGEDFYNLISALHKSIRGSDPNAALYWFCRMIDGGCDPIYLARRIVRIASEDIGNADPRALELAMNAWDAQERLGSPEGELTMAQAVLYLSAAPKSNAVYKAYNQALEDVRSHGSLEVPIHLRNAPTKLMNDLGYGKSYRYAHDEPNAFAAGENYFPKSMKQKEYYKPVSRGLEIQIKEKLERLKDLNKLK